MRTASLRALIAVPFTVVLMFVLGYAGLTAWAPVATKVIQKVNNKDTEVTQLVGHYYRHAAFWTPLILVGVLALVIGAMLYASSSRTGLVTGTVIGVIVVVLMSIFGHHLIPKGADAGMAWQGTKFVLAFMLSVVLLTIYGAIAARVGRD